MKIKSKREQLGYPKWDEGIDCSKDVVLTQQHLAEDCDINNIILKHARGEAVNIIDPAQMIYGDFTSLEDFHSTMNRLKRTEEAWEQMPANIKKRFNQNPGELIEFLNNDANREEAEQLGLVEKKQPLIYETPPQKDEKKEKPRENTGV